MFETLLAALRKNYLAPLRVVTAVCFLLFATALVCCLPHRTAPAVRASSGSTSAVGAALFHEKGCEHCHGVDGRGGERGPDLSTIGKRWKKPQIEHQIHDGGAGMPAFADALQPDEITALVEYLHTKRKAPKGPKMPKMPMGTPASQPEQPEQPTPPLN